MEQLSTSSTDIAHPHLGLARTVEAEPAAPEPALDGPDLLPDSTRVHGQGEEEEQRADDDAGVVLGQHRQQGEGVDLPGEVELVEEERDEREEGRADDHARPAPQASD